MKPAFAGLLPLPPRQAERHLDSPVPSLAGPSASAAPLLAASSAELVALVASAELAELPADQSVVLGKSFVVDSVDS